MRFKNFSQDVLQIPYSIWTPPQPKDGLITMSLVLPPGALTDELDPSDPIVAQLMKAHPELKPLVIRNAWEKVLAEIL